MKDAWRKMQVPIFGVIGILLIVFLVVAKLGLVGDKVVAGKASYSDYKLYDAQFTGSAGCADIYDPVCGNDGVTYDNLCLLKAAATTPAYQGGCQS